MRQSNRSIINTIRSLFKVGMLNETFLDLAEKSPTKFVREAQELLTKVNNFVQHYKFRSYGMDVTLFIDTRWIPFIKAAAGNKINVIKALRSVSGYTPSDAVAFDHTKNPCELSWLNSGNRNGAGLADAKCAMEGGIPGLI